MRGTNICAPFTLVSGSGNRRKEPDTAPRGRRTKAPRVNKYYRDITTVTMFDFGFY